MKITKKILILPSIVALMASAYLFTGCASAPKHTEQLLSEAGFRTVNASTDKQMEHLQSLPTDRITVARIKGKSYYIFPDPAHNRIYVGNPEEYQTYRQILTYSTLEQQSRVLAFEDGGSGDDSDKWVEWTNATGWTHASD